MKKKQILFIIGLLLLAPFINAQKNRYIKSDKYEGVIFSKYPYIPFEGSNHPYIPSDKEVATMEKKITDSMCKLILAYKVHNKYFEDNCHIANNLSKYKRHYFGYWYKGDKIIRINFFISEEKDWKKGMFLVEDGGCRYFQLKYSINSNTLHDLSIGALF